MSRSDVIPIDSRSHLEVADRKHRYAKNLRTYFKEYHRINGLSDIVERSAPSNENSTPSRKWTRYEPFFEWLDNTESLPNLPDCPRSVLDEDRVEYLTSQAERERYEITINGTGIIGSSDADGTTGEKLWRMTQTGEPVNTGSKGWIFVLLNGRLYACEKRTNTFPRFHHSSFFAGASVSAAGMLVCVNGKLTKLFPHSGHYRPHDRHLYSLLAFLRDKGVDLSAVQVDVQRVMKLSRLQDKDGSKAKKTDSAFYLDGETAYHFLKSKTGFQECGALRHINKRRLDYAEGEQSAPVRVKTTAISTMSSPVPAAAVETEEDALGQLPVLHKADSNDEHHSPSERAKLRLSISTTGSAAVPALVPASSSASNRSSLNMNRLSLSSTGGGYASTVGSTSPFCSPVAQHNLYPLHCSSSGGIGGNEGSNDGGDGSIFNFDRAVTVSQPGNSSSSAGGDGGDGIGGVKNDTSYTNDNYYSNRSNGLFGSNSNDEYNIEALIRDMTHDQQQQQQQLQQQQQQQHQPQAVSLFGSGGRSSADARARLLNTMLYADTTTAATTTERPTGVNTNNTNTGGIDNNNNTGGGNVDRSSCGEEIRGTGVTGVSIHNNTIHTSAGRNNKASNPLPLPPSSPAPALVAAPTAVVRSVSNTSNSNSHTVNILNTTSYNTNGNAVYVQNAVATPILKIPVAAPIKKVPSYSSISSSYGSSSFAQPQTTGVYSSRSRSASKAEHDFDYDLRMLLGESPSIQVPDSNYFNYDATAASPVNAYSNYNQYYNNYNANHTNSNSTCNSRGRSRGSSYNPPYIPTATATTTTTGTTNISAASAGHNLHSSVSNNSISGTNSGSGSGHNTRSNSLYSSAGNGYNLRDPNSAEHSPAADKHSPRSSIGSTSVGVNVSGVGVGVGGSALNNNKGSSSAEKKVGTSIGKWSPSSSATATATTTAGGAGEGEGEEKVSSVAAHLFSEDILIPPVAVAAGAAVSTSMFAVCGDEKNTDLRSYTPAAATAVVSEDLYAGSPQPSFASSLSSTDSLPNMLLSYVMSPGGTTLHHCFDGQGEGDGMYDEEVLGDSYHDHLYGGGG